MEMRAQDSVPSPRGRGGQCFAMSWWTIWSWMRTGTACTLQVLLRAPRPRAPADRFLLAGPVSDFLNSLGSPITLPEPPSTQPQPIRPMTPGKVPKVDFDKVRQSLHELWVTEESYLRKVSSLLKVRSLVLNSAYGASLNSLRCTGLRHSPPHVFETTRYGRHPAVRSDASLHQPRTARPHRRSLRGRLAAARLADAEGQVESAERLRRDHPAACAFGFATVHRRVHNDDAPACRSSEWSRTRSGSPTLGRPRRSGGNSTSTTRPFASLSSGRRCTVERRRRRQEASRSSWRSRFSACRGIG